MITAVENDLARAALLLERAKAPTILVGPDARGASSLLGDLARALGAAVLTTPDAKSLFDETSPLAAGVFSFGASDITSAIADSTDVVLAIGTNLGEFATQSGRAFARAAIVHMTEDPFDLAIALRATVTIVGDVALHVRQLAEQIRATPEATPWFEGLRARVASPVSQALPRDKGAIDPGQAARALGRVLTPHARVACDVTSAALHVLRDLRFAEGQRLWLQIERSACMGSALAAGLGVRLASGVPTLVIIGDWGLMMGSSELHTAASMEIGSFVVVVWSNAGGALIRAGVRAQGLEVPAETHTWSNPRFASVARGYGMRALTVRTASGLARAAAAALQAPFPVLIDAVIEPNAEIPGAGARYLHLDASSARP
jgi:thiamine pyrophosphate-dependent acetolactate synthase large subunit-like protein